MSQIQGMTPEPQHRHSGQGTNPASSRLPTDGGAVGDGHASGEPHTLADGTVAWPPDWDEEKKAEWRRRNGLAPPSEPGAGP